MRETVDPFISWYGSIFIAVILFDAIPSIFTSLAEDFILGNDTYGQLACKIGGVVDNILQTALTLFILVSLVFFYAAVFSTKYNRRL